MVERALGDGGVVLLHVDEGSSAVRARESSGKGESKRE